jgi:hypothetical protein
MTALHSSNINLKKNEDSANVGIAQELQQTNDYSTELYGNVNNFSSGTEMLAYPDIVARQRLTKNFPQQLIFVGGVFFLCCPLASKV